MHEGLGWANHKEVFCVTVKHGPYYLGGFWTTMLMNKQLQPVFQLFNHVQS